MAGACGQGDLSEGDGGREGRVGEKARGGAGGAQSKEYQHTGISVIGLCSRLSPNVKLDW